jgi:pseudaminic acid synthase
MQIAGRPIGDEHPPYLIAELSANHNGDIGRMMELIDAAAETGADAIKIQTYVADSITIDHDSDDFQIKGGPWGGRTLYDLYKEAQTPFEWHESIFARAKERGVTVFSSPFDFSAIDLLAKLDAPAYKIASFEAVDLPLIRKAASNGKPLIISTGMANLPEIDEAVSAARQAGDGGVVLLHCISGYPAPANESNLRTIPHLRDAFGTVVGLSDHTLGDGVSVASIALGARVIEKHFTLRRADGGPDSHFSLEPDEFKRLVDNCRMAFEAIGHVTYERAEVEKSNAVFRRSLYVVKDVAKGEPFSDKNVRSIRPGYGLAPKHYERVLGRRAKSDIARGTALSWSLVE